MGVPLPLVEANAQNVRFHGGNSTFINSLHKTKFLFHSLTEAVPQFL